MMHDDRNDAALVEAAMTALSQGPPAGDVDETAMSRIWLRARLVGLARPHPAEALMDFGAVASAAFAGIAALGLIAVFWTEVHGASPIAAASAVIGLGALVLFGAALVFRLQAQM